MLQQWTIPSRGFAFCAVYGVSYSLGVMVDMNLACCGLKPNAYCGETKLMHHARSAGVISAKKFKLGIVNGY